MTKFIQDIAHHIAVDYCRLSIVDNPDGLLHDADVRYRLKQECGLEVVLGSNLDLRLHYELHYKASSDDGHYIYVTTEPANILPDMMAVARCLTFKVGDVFPLFGEKRLLRKLPLQELELVYERCAGRPIRSSECAKVIADVTGEAEHRRQTSLEQFKQRIGNMNADWNNMVSTMNLLSQIFIDAVDACTFEDLTDEFDSINESFQSWLDNNYFMQKNSSHINRVPCVNKALPHIENNLHPGEKLAMVVIDGLAYWQYTILRDALNSAGIATAESTTLSWLPSITMLSRQALFRGDVPNENYHQSPSAERKLWQDYWMGRGVSSEQIQSIYDNEEFAVNEAVTRLSVVTVEMDEKMHAAYDYRDLLSLTRNWAPRMVQKIGALKRIGFKVYLTTDHGSKLSYGWRALSTVEKVFLYSDGSRGKRHVIYNNKTEQENFYRSANGEVAILKHDNWLCMRSNDCFERSGVRRITHGGCSVSEVVIPFIRI